MMSQKKRAKTSYHSLIETLAPVDNETTPPGKETFDNTHNCQVALNDLSYIGHKAVSILSSVLSLIETPNNEKLALNILQDLELARFSARKMADNISLPMVEPKDNGSVLKSVDVQMPGAPILLQLTLFPLVPYPIKGAYNVYYDVKEALFQYAEIQPFCFDTHSRFTLAYQRVIRGPVRLATGCCDNDNFEMKRVTNAITEAIGIADSADKFSFYYTTISGQEPKTRVFLVYEKDFPMLLKDNQFKYETQA